MLPPVGQFKHIQGSWRFSLSSMEHFFKSLKEIQQFINLQNIKSGLDLLVVRAPQQKKTQNTSNVYPILLEIGAKKTIIVILV